MLMAITAEIRIGEARVAVNRYGEHVAAVVEDVLLPVAVVIVDVQDRRPPELGKVVRGHRGVAEIAEPAEYPTPGMVARRAGPRLSHAAAAQHLVGGRPGAVDPVQIGSASGRERGCPY